MSSDFRSRSAVAVRLLLTIASGCGSPEAVAPDLDLACAATHDAGGDAGSLATALAAAVAGDCVTLGSATYVGSFDVPAGVIVVGGRGKSPVVTSPNAAQPALIIADAAGATLANLAVSDAPGVGVLIANGAATLLDVTVTGASDRGVQIGCASGDCLLDARNVSLSGVHLRANNNNLWIEAARVALTGGECSLAGGQSLTSGFGIVAFDGAVVTIDGTRIEQNEDIGLLLDGDATVAALDNVSVSWNGGRGIWAQRLRGSVAAPALEVSGGSSIIEGNRVTGIGARDSVGISITAVTVRSTRLATIADAVTGSFEIGDGVGLFANSAQVTLDRVLLEGNERSQMLVDLGGMGIIIINGRFNPPVGAFKVVVQNTASTVDVPPDALSQDAPELSVPGSNISF